MKNESKTDSLTDGDLDKIANLLDNRIAPLATKEFVEELVKGEITGLKSYVNEGFEQVMEGMDSLSKQMVEKKQVERLEDWAKVVGDKVGFKPKL